jgi:hypothetical protein
MLGMKRGEGGLVFNGLKDLSLSRQASSRGDQGVMSLIVVLVKSERASVVGRDGYGKDG